MIVLTCLSVCFEEPLKDALFKVTKLKSGLVPLSLLNFAEETYL